jgi:hypothetical protein
MLNCKVTQISSCSVHVLFLTERWQAIVKGPHSVYRNVLSDSEGSEGMEDFLHNEDRDRVAFDITVK